MGVEYSTVVGYGFVIGEPDYEKVTYEYDSGEEYLPEVLGDIIYDSYPLLELAHYGNAWSGSDMGVAVIVKSSKASTYGIGGMMAVPHAHMMKQEELIQLREVHALLFGGTGATAELNTYSLSYVF